MSMVWKRTPAGDMAFNRCPLNATGTVLLWNLMMIKKGRNILHCVLDKLLEGSHKYAYMWIYLHKPRIFTYAYACKYTHVHMLSLTAYIHAWVCGVCIYISVYTHICIHIIWALQLQRKGWQEISLTGSIRQSDENEGKHKISF